MSDLPDVIRTHHSTYHSTISTVIQYCSIVLLYCKELQVTEVRVVTEKSLV